MPVTAIDPRTALVVIDLQKGIASRPTLTPMKDIVASNVRLANAFRAVQLPVVLVRVAFSADGGDVLHPRADLTVPLPPMTPDFFEILPELGPTPSDIVVTKRQWNAFYGTDLDLQLRRRRMTGIVLTGVSTSIGVESTARAAMERGYNVTFASDAITDVDAIAHECAMMKILPRIGEIDSADAIVARLRG